MPDDACSELVAIAERLARVHPKQRAFLRALAREGAGIRGGPLALLDLGRGGRNPVRGGGFRPVYTDGTGGQVRHFCGVARAVALLGSGPARWLMERSGDRFESPDGQLTEAAITFVAGLRSGRIPVAEAASWIDERLCADCGRPRG